GGWGAGDGQAEPGGDERPWHEHGHVGGWGRVRAPDAALPVPAGLRRSVDRGHAADRRRLRPHREPGRAEGEVRGGAPAMTQRFDAETVTEAMASPRWSALVRTGLDLSAVATWDPAVVRESRVLVPVAAPRRAPGPPANRVPLPARPPRAGGAAPGPAHARARPRRPAARGRAPPRGAPRRAPPRDDDRRVRDPPSAPAAARPLGGPAPPRAEGRRRAARARLRARGRHREGRAARAVAGGRVHGVPGRSDRARGRADRRGRRLAQLDRCLRRRDEPSVVLRSAG